ncbi:tRNA (guanosine(46)-N7)-methyltransferase TrmB [Amorphus orientalis]|uniref:tRNA (guanine-N(7)-)-methyltransferase n=1 Tax=Amorphus orientalis TaxID=649198 RepID=A0AAE4AUD7_9HYPH|nr:tRNA (guanosine(46)-N7)-methyltransferase TrmB [Amorphus orientalis]MDQ0317022.1 tRNA (guanine-N7-)-methyltransferase [Amorphus orientalis]
MPCATPSDKDDQHQGDRSGPGSADGPEGSQRTLFGRRKGHPLTATRAALFDTVLPPLAVPLDGPIADPARLFPDPVRAVRMEIGFGGGEHLIHEAKGAPNVGFIGCEPFVNGMAKALAAVDAGGLTNVRLHFGDAAEVLDLLPEASIERVDLLYPDPWPKKRHWKRRFVGPENLDRLACVITPGGTFRFASDIPSYIEWTLNHLWVHPAFRWTAQTADDWRKPYPGWPGTRYEAKAIEAGRVPAYLTFERV